MANPCELQGIYPSESPKNQRLVGVNVSLRGTSSSRNFTRTPALHIGGRLSGDSLQNTNDFGDGIVVIPALNEERCIGPVIENILGDLAAYKLLIVVADGGSTDHTREIVRGIAVQHQNVMLLNNPARLQSAGVNLAARQFGNGRRWLIRMDAHAEYPVNFITNLLVEARRTGASSVVVAMKSIGKTCFQQAAATAQNSVLGAGGSAHRRDGAEGFVDHGHHALFDMDRFLALGGYDAGQSHNEDAEFDCRLAQSGGRIWLTRAASIGYYPRDRAAGLFHQYKNYGRGRAMTILRHRLRPKPRQLVPAAVAPAIALVAIAPWLPMATLPALLWVGVSLLFGLFLGLRERSVCASASGVAAILMHLGWSVGFWSAFFEHSFRPRPRNSVVPEMR
jgi:succinoglycan biosynthesis protein ExoA